MTATDDVDFCTTISLCAGGGGLDLGLELAIRSARPVVYVEREAFAVAHLVAAIDQGVLAPAPIWSDARTFDGRRWRGCVDGLIGGIPCQPHSVAGKRDGADDERDLWTPTRRIIAQARPWFVLIENVAGMLAGSGTDDVAGAHRVRRDLYRLGFAVEGGLFTAEEVGATHERGRLFILGVADTGDARLQGSQQRRSSGDQHRRETPRSVAEFRRPSVGVAIGRDLDRRPDQPIGRSQERIVAVGAGIGNDDLDIAPPRPSDLDGWRRVLAHSPHLEPAVRRMADDVAVRLDLSGPHAARIDRLRLLGNGVVPLQAAHAIRTLAHRLAATGAAGAARLVWLMTGEESNEAENQLGR